MRKIFKKISNLSVRSSSILIVLMILISMLFLTTYMRSEYNKNPSALSIMAKTSGVTTDEINVAIKLDSENGDSLYRKILTYNSIIFLCGVLLVSVVNFKNKNQS